MLKVCHAVHHHSCKSKSADIDDRSYLAKPKAARFPEYFDDPDMLRECNVDLMPPFPEHGIRQKLKVTRLVLG